MGHWILLNGAKVHFSFVSWMLDYATSFGKRISIDQDERLSCDLNCKLLVNKEFVSKCL